MRRGRPAGMCRSHPGPAPEQPRSPAACRRAGTLRQTPGLCTSLPTRARQGWSVASPVGLTAAGRPALHWAERHLCAALHLAARRRGALCGLPAGIPGQGEWGCSCAHLAGHQARTWRPGRARPRALRLPPAGPAWVVETVPCPRHELLWNSCLAAGCDRVLWHAVLQSPDPRRGMALLAAGANAYCLQQRTACPAAKRQRRFAGRGSSLQATSQAVLSDGARTTPGQCRADPGTIRAQAEQTDGRTDGRTDGQTDGRTDGQTSLSAR